MELDTKKIYTIIATLKNGAKKVVGCYDDLAEAEIVVKNCLFDEQLEKIEIKEGDTNE